MVTVNLYDVVQALAVHARALTGMRSAPDNPPDSINMYPFAITYFMRGRWWGNDATWKTSADTWAIDIHLAKVPDIGRVLEACAEMPEALAQAIVSDETLGGTVTHIDEVRAEFRAMNYAGVDTAGYHLEIDATLKSAKS